MQLIVEFHRPICPSKFGVDKVVVELVLATVSTVGNTERSIEADSTTVEEGVGAEDSVALAI